VETNRVGLQQQGLNFRSDLLAFQPSRVSPIAKKIAHQSQTSKLPSLGIWTVI
jgi:hypothetical protein